MSKRSDAEIFGMLDEALAFGYAPVAHDESVSLLGIQPAETNEPAPQSSAASLILGGLQKQIQHAHKPAA